MGCDASCYGSKTSIPAGRLSSNKVAPHHHTKKQMSTLGIIRLDYDYPAAPGDIDSPESFAYDVFYKVVPGLTFEMC